MSCESNRFHPPSSAECVPIIHKVPWYEICAMHSDSRFSLLILKLKRPKHNVTTSEEWVTYSTTSKLWHIVQHKFVTSLCTPMNSWNKLGLNASKDAVWTPFGDSLHVRSLLWWLWNLSYKNARGRRSGSTSNLRCQVWGTIHWY